MKGSADLYFIKVEGGLKYSISALDRGRGHRYLAETDAIRKWLLTDLGPVHTMLDKFENATLLLRLRLPSTLVRLYLHKKIRENGTF